MQTELDNAGLSALLAKQIDHLFVINDGERAVISNLMEKVLTRAAKCFAATDNKYYKRDGKPYFSPFHSGQYSVYLYFFSNEVFREYEEKHRSLADRIYYLNKALNGLDLYYEVAMPDVFFLDHPVGSVLGRASYGEGFSFSQHCTVGNNKDVYPVFGKNVQMLSGSKVLGACKIGDNVVFAANSYVKDMDVPSDTIVFGQSPNNILKQK